MRINAEKAQPQKERIYQPFPTLESFSRKTHRLPTTYNNTEIILYRGGMR